MRPADPRPAGLDPVERAHLRRPDDRSHTMARDAPSPALAPLVDRFWVPVWDVPPGDESPQQVLQHPVTLVVVAHDYARFVGPATGMTTRTLTGRGWAVGVLCRPAAGYLIAGGPVAPFVDRAVDLGEVLGEATTGLVARVREAMADDPAAPDAQATARAAVEEVLARFLPVDDEGRAADRLVDLVQSRPDVVRVAQLCDELGLTERALQRLARRRLGLTPKWLIQRRRLQEAAGELRAGTAGLAEIAARLGYADQPHLQRDFVRVVGMTPGAFAALHARPSSPG